MIDCAMSSLTSGGRLRGKPRALAEACGPFVFLDQRQSFLRKFWVSIEIGFQARRLHAECPKRPAFAKCDHHPRCFFV